MKLQEIRKKSGLTQQEIANKLGISQQAYGNYERYTLSIPAKMMEKIAKILMIDPSQLVYEPNLENDSITEFLHKSLTAYHAVYNAISLLEKEGFKELKESESWNIKEGGKYYVTKNRSALIAFIVGDLSHYAFNIASC
ncbi:MAG: helix-turn-helix domain-containing protein, partial [Bacilli bacterium]|nr:helix-turn-helix domain-containing protein [Bacilli bacterium]